MPRFIQVTEPNSAVQGGVWLKADDVVRIAPLQSGTTEVHLSSGYRQLVADPPQELLAKISSTDAVDAARYRWLRADNGYAAEEATVTGGDELDHLCDQGIARDALQQR